MKKHFSRFSKIILFSVLIFSLPQNFFPYVVKYKEDWYKLYHIHYAQNPDDCIENIYYLEKATLSDFCNPLFCDAGITTEKEWEKYRYLFQMHINLKLIEQHLRLRRIYDKKVKNFYDAPWKDEYLRNLEKTLSCYEAGLYYWKEAKLWAEKANVNDFNFLFITKRQAWEDERERIKTGELDYTKILNREIERVKKVQKEFLETPSKSY